MAAGRLAQYRVALAAFAVKLTSPGMRLAYSSVKPDHAHLGDYIQFQPKSKGPRIPQLCETASMARVLLFQRFWLELYIIPLHISYSLIYECCKLMLRLPCLYSIHLAKI